MTQGYRWFWENVFWEQKYLELFVKVKERECVFLCEREREGETEREKEGGGSEEAII